ncbi:hypothetical protein ACFL27_09610, partial [candidate division CSSED10-310 bacterium]
MMMGHNESDMMMNLDYTLNIDSQSKHDRVTRHIEEHLQMNKTVKQPLPESSKPVTERILHLQKYPGNFIKSCPGTREPYLCCGYYVLNLAHNCPL